MASGTTLIYLLIKSTILFTLGFYTQLGDPDDANEKSRHRHGKSKEIQEEGGLHNLYHHQERRDTAKKKHDDRNCDQSFRTVKHHL